MNRKKFNRALSLALATILALSSLNIPIASAGEIEPTEVYGENVEETSESVAETSESTETTEESESSEVVAEESEETVETTAEETLSETSETTAVETTEVSEETATEVAYAFSQTIVTSGVKVAVTAPAGVFPEDAKLSVKKAGTTADISEAIEDSREDEVNVAGQMTFDIKVVDASGNELQPDGDVTVSFELDESALPVRYDDVAVYHISDTAEELEVSASSDEDVLTLEADTDGFSYYTVEFYYDDLEYVMEGDSSLKLSEIQEALGLSGDVTSVVFSDSSLVSLEKDDDGDWDVTALKSFDTEETLTITVDGAKYVVKVTDDTKKTAPIDVNVRKNNEGNSTGGINGVTYDLYVAGQIIGSKAKDISTVHSGATSSVITYVGDTYSLTNLTLPSGYVYTGMYPNADRGETYTHPWGCASATSFNGVLPEGGLAINMQIETIYNVIFNSNGGSGSMDNQAFTYFESKNLTANAFTREGYTFKGWSTSSGSTTVKYTDSKQVSKLSSTANGKVQLYAVWEPDVTIKGYTGTYDGEAHDVASSVSIPSDATIVYKDSDGNSYSELPQQTNAGTYTYTYTVTASKAVSVTGSFTCTIKKAKADVSIEQTTITVEEQESVATKGVTTNTDSDCVISASSGDESIFTVSVSDDGNNTLSIIGTGSGTATLTVKSSETDNFEEATSTYTVTVTDGSVVVVAEDKTVTYNGKVQKPDAVQVIGVTATITYGTDGKTYNLSSPSGYTDAGVYTIYYKIAIDGAEPTYGTYTFTIEKADQGEPTVNDDDLTYNGSEQALGSVTPGEGGAAVTYSLTESGEYSSSVPTKTDAGTYTVYYKIEGDKNHNDTSGSYEVTINKKKITVPVAASGLVYNGSEQTGVAATSGCSVTGGKQTDANVYKATATLDDTTNCTWADGTTAAKTINWSISRADAKVTLSSTSGTTKMPDAVTFTASTTNTDPDGNLVVESSDTSVATVSIADDGTVTVTPVSIGTATITVTSTGSTNFNAASAKYKFTVNVAVTYDYNLDAQYTGSDIAGTGVTVSWGEDFTVTTTFKLNSLSTNKRALVFGNFSDNNGTSSGQESALNVEITKNSNLRVYIVNDANGGVSSEKIPVGKDVTITFSWDSDSKTWTITTDTGISMSKTISSDLQDSKHVFRLGCNDFRVNEGGKNAFIDSDVVVSDFKVTVTKPKGEALSEISDATSTDGYTFEGWKTERAGGTKVTSSNVVPSSDITYYANWSYYIAFDANTGTGSMDKQGKLLYNGSKVALSANTFKKTGYTFDKWNTAKDGSGTSYSDKEAVKNVRSVSGGIATLYAQWKANTYTVTFDANGGTGTMKDQSFTYDKAQNLSTNEFTREGYTFLGWSENSSAATATYTDGQEVSNLTDKANGKVTLYAVWKINDYKLTIHYKSVVDGTTVAEDYVTTVTYGKSYSKTSPDVDGYTAKTAVVSGTMGAADVEETVYYRKDASDATITCNPSEYVYDGQAKEPEVTVTLSDGTVLVEGTDYTVSYSDNVNAGQAKVTVTYIGNYDGTSSENYTIKKATPEVSLAPEEDSTTYPDGVTFKATTTNTDDVKMTYSAQAGSVIAVSMSEDGIVTITPTGTGVATVTITSPESANFVAATATYTVTISEGTMVVSANDETLTYNGSAQAAGDAPVVTSPASGTKIYYSTTDPSDPDFTDDMWTEEMPEYTDVGTYKTYYKVEAHGYTTVSGSWTTTIKTKDVSDSTISVDDVPDQIWEVDEEQSDAENNKWVGKEQTPSVNVKDSQTGKTLVEGVDYELTYTKNEEEGTASITIKGIGNYSGERVVTFSIVKEIYTLLFYPNGGNWNGSTDPREADRKDHSTFIIVAAPDREGYKFIEWRGSSYQPGDDYLVVEDHEFTAIWEAVEYSVIFDANGGTGTMENQSFTYDESRKLSDNAFTRAGFVFAGWNTAKDGSGKSYTNMADVLNLAATEGATVTLYAQWQAVTPESTSPNVVTATGEADSITYPAGLILMGLGAMFFIIGKRRKEES